MRQQIARFASLVALHALALEAAAAQEPTGRGLDISIRRGRVLFREASFGGNGRTCLTCHGDHAGTLSPEDVRALYRDDPNGALFRSIDSDDGLGTSYERLSSEATIRVSVPLPPNVRLASDPSATELVLRRGIPSTLDTPALDTVFMLDGREPDLESQALGAIRAHAEPGFLPGSSALASLTAFERTLFSSDELACYAEGAALPLPEGDTDAERRGRAFFEPSALCGACHAGPLLNEVPDGNMFGLPPGIRFARAFVSELNPGQRPVHDLRVTLPDGSIEAVSTPDPGHLLVTGDLEDLNTFKIPILWNVRNTAPYFHDNSALTLEHALQHYADFFALLDITLSDAEQADIVAFLQLL